ncbi:hypothetical protein DFH07DRAFT_956105 [Mycena maculata]|uniref:Uncharacterized protein n=1 Tax=Mycena maculata TaxID=230809 RepID=A0AAD7JG09_9AGAR|nr:hypothetical protein DFH07DRAFT_966239 [Mycena maculata]KAJ7764089.1 hypothetical protein DFH07DRAFT_956105 [Mycena maculata]
MPTPHHAFSRVKLVSLVHYRRLPAFSLLSPVLLGPSLCLLKSYLPPSSFCVCSSGPSFVLASP